MQAQNRSKRTRTKTHEPKLNTNQFFNTKIIKRTKQEYMFNKLGKPKPELELEFTKNELKTRQTLFKLDLAHIQHYLSPYLCLYYSFRSPIKYLFIAIPTLIFSINNGCWLYTIFF